MTLHTPIGSRQILLPVHGLEFPGILHPPQPGRGLVVFAHGSGSSRHSPRNQSVASVLCQAGLGALLFDLLTEDEAASRLNVFDIRLLADRLLAAARWIMTLPETSRASIGLFGASTGAAAALTAAADEPLIAAVVSRGGRPDLAFGALERVRAPTLLIVGARDTEVLGLNRHALDALQCEKHLAVVPGATHLFEEPGALEQAAQVAAAWFAEHLRPGSAA